MNRNHLKFIACLSMLIDHIGYVLFPEVQLFRIIGRIAMPLFAFFIGEGCLHTRDRKKYFLRLFILALICQAVYVGESIITGSGNGLYLNILFTFSFSVILCSIFIRSKEEDTFKWWLIFAVTAAAFWGMDLLFEYISDSVGVNLHLDYGIEGIMLPLFALTNRGKWQKLICFAVGLFFFAVSHYGLFNLYFAFAMIPAVLLCFYNGQGGKRIFKYFFYLFYPLHLAVIYGVNILINL